MGSLFHPSGYGDYDFSRFQCDDRVLQESGRLNVVHSNWTTGETADIFPEIMAMWGEEVLGEC